MSKELFDNVGKYLKELAEILYYRILIPYVLVGITLIVCGCVFLADGIAWGAVGFLIAIAIFYIGHCNAKLKVAEIYAHGEIADRLISIDSKLSSNRKAAKSDPVTVKVVEKAENPLPRRTAPWDCPFCGCKNPQDSRYCKSCGTEDIGM